MDNLKIDDSILTKNLCISGSGYVTSFGLTQPKLTPAQQILPMIEQRIRNEVEPQAWQAEKDLTAIIAIELRKLGIDVNMTNTHTYASGIADKYRERLVRERIKAIVDGLVSEKPVEAEKGSAACDAYGMPAKMDSHGIITVTLPPNLTQEQRDKITDSLKHQLPADMQIVSLPHGVQMGRV